MRDLIDRLRDPDHLREWGTDIDALCAEAAQEIEFLRAVLRQIATLKVTIRGIEQDPSEDMRDIARQALKNPRPLYAYVPDR
jgi:hypothetical protein